MTRYLFRFLCVCALGVVPLVGCGQSLGSIGGVFPCTEQGIRDAIAEGGGPHTFECDGPTTVVTEAEIVIDNDVILDGEGNLTVDGNRDHDVFAVAEGVTAGLRGFTVTNGADDPMVSGAGGIRNLRDATLTLTNCTVSGNTGGGITNRLGSLTLSNSTVSGNTGRFGGIDNIGTLTLMDSTVSGNTATNDGGGIAGGGGGIEGVTLINSTVSGNSAPSITTCLPFAGACGPLTLINSTVSGNITHREGMLTMTNSLVAGGCDRVGISNGYNVESPGNTCGFDQEGDQVNVSAAELDLQPLADNGGPTQTHAITTDSAAFNAGTCQVDEDQRGVTRPQGPACDVGAFELEP